MQVVVVQLLPEVGPEGVQEAGVTMAVVVSRLHVVCVKPLPDDLGVLATVQVLGSTAIGPVLFGTHVRERHWLPAVGVVGTALVPPGQLFTGWLVKLSAATTGKQVVVT